MSCLDSKTLEIKPTPPGISLGFPGPKLSSRHQGWSGEPEPTAVSGLVEGDEADLVRVPKRVASNRQE